MRKRMIPAALFLGALISIIPNGVCSAGRLNVAFIGLSKATADRIASAYQKYSRTNRLNTRICDISNDMTTVLLDNPTDILISTKEMLTDNADVGIFADLNKVLPKSVIRDIMPTYIEAYSNKGKLYAVPLMGYTYTLFYNKTMFKKAGLPGPKPDWTWEGNFYRTAVKLNRDKDGNGIPEVYGINVSHPIDFMTTLYSMGGTIADKGFKKAAYSEGAGLKATEFIAGLYKEKLVQPIDYSTWKDDDMSTWMVYDGKSGMSIQSYHPTLDMSAINKRAKASGIPYEFGCTLVPKGSKGSVPVIDSWVCSALVKSAKKPEVADFMKFLCSTAGQDITSDYSMPTTFSGLGLKRIIKYSGAPLIQNYQRGYAHNARRIYRDLRNLWWSDMEKVGKGEITIAELVNRAKSIGREQLSKASANIF